MKTSEIDPPLTRADSQNMEQALLANNVAYMCGDEQIPFALAECGCIVDTTGFDPIFQGILMDHEEKNLGPRTKKPFLYPFGYQCESCKDKERKQTMDSCTKGGFGGAAVAL